MSSINKTNIFLYFQINLLIKSIIIVVLTIVKTSTAGILAPNALFANLEQSQNPFESNEYTDHNGYLVRSKRAAYIVPNDYYANYYNDYYNNYYNRPSNGYKPQTPTADRFDGNDDDFDNNIVSSQGTKYVYTPIFKYKSTQQKRHKLFVPNLFG